MKAWSLCGMMRGVGGVRKSIDQSWLAKRLGLGLISLGFNGSSGWGSVERGLHSSNRVSGISTGTMYRSTNPSFSQTIWARWASRQFLTLPIVQTLLPVTFGYSLLSLWDNCGDKERLWRRSLTCSHRRTSMGTSISCCNGTTSALQPEEITSKGTWVSCVYYQLKFPYKKSPQTYLMILVYIHIYREREWEECVSVYWVCMCVLRFFVLELKSLLASCFSRGLL